MKELEYFLLCGFILVAMGMAVAPKPPTAPCVQEILFNAQIENRIQYGCNIQCSITNGTSSCLGDCEQGARSLLRSMVDK